MEKGRLLMEYIWSQMLSTEAKEQTGFFLKLMSDGMFRNLIQGIVGDKTMSPYNFFKERIFGDLDNETKKTNMSEEERVKLDTVGAFVMVEKEELGDKDARLSRVLRQ